MRPLIIRNGIKLEIKGGREIAPGVVWNGKMVFTKIKRQYERKGNV